MSIDHENNGPEAELWALVGERTRPGADKADIDRRIWQRFGARGAVMFTDLSGFSRRVAEFGITHFLQEIYEHKRLLLPLVRSHGGQVLRAEGDSLLVWFPDPREALLCAVEMQQACRKYNLGKAPEDEVLLCVGIGYGDILKIGDLDVWGVEVNTASRLGEDIAVSYQIMITAAAHEAIGELPGYRYERLGVQIVGSKANYEVLYPGKP